MICNDIDMRLAALRNPTNLDHSYFIPKTGLYSFVFLCKNYVFITLSSSPVVQIENLKFDNGNAENQPDSEEESAELQIDESWDNPPRKETFSHYTNKPDHGQYEVEVTESWDDISDQNTCPKNSVNDEEFKLQILDSLNNADANVTLNQPTDNSLFQTLNESFKPSYSETDVSTYFDKYSDKELYGAL